MQNSLQQLNKQKKSATDASAETAKHLNMQMKNRKCYALNFFYQAKYEGVKTDDLVKQLEVLQQYKVST